MHRIDSSGVLPCVFQPKNKSCINYSDSGLQQRFKDQWVAKVIKKKRDTQFWLKNKTNNNKQLFPFNT